MGGPPGGSGQGAAARGAVEGGRRYKSVRCGKRSSAPARGRSRCARSFCFPGNPAPTLTTGANVATNRHVWTFRMIRPGRFIATVVSSRTQRNKGEAATGRTCGPDTGHAAAVVPARARPLTIPAKNCDALANPLYLNDPGQGVPRRLPMLNDWDAAGEFANGYTDAFTDPFFFDTLQRSNHGCGAASTLIRMAAPAAPSAKGATWMD